MEKSIKEKHSTDGAGQTISSLYQNIQRKPFIKAGQREGLGII
jgi:hypothetical protein